MVKKSYPALENIFSYGSKIHQKALLCGLHTTQAFWKLSELFMCDLQPRVFALFRGHGDVEFIGMVC